MENGFCYVGLKGIEYCWGMGRLYWREGIGGK